LPFKAITNDAPSTALPPRTRRPASTGCPVDRPGRGATAGGTARCTPCPSAGTARRRTPRHGTHAARCALPVAHPVDTMAGMGCER